MIGPGKGRGRACNWDSALGISPSKHWDISLFQHARTSGQYLSQTGWILMVASKLKYVTEGLEQQQPLCATLLELWRRDLMSVDADIAAMEVFVEVMEPFVRIMEIMGSESWVTISAARLLLFKLLSHHLPESPSDSRLKEQVKSAVLAKLKVCYENTALLDKACFLDPRFKGLSFLSQTERSAIVHTVEEELAADLDTLDTTAITSSDCAEPSPKKPKKGTLMDLLSYVLGTETAEDSPVNTAEKAHREVAKYVAFEPVQDHHPLKENSRKLPLLSKLAKKYPVYTSNICAFRTSFQFGRIHRESEKGMPVTRK